MKLSFATLGCPNWSVERVVASAKDMGFDGVELRGAPGEHIGPDESTESRRHIAGLFQDAGLDIACIMGYTNFCVEDKRAESVEVGRKFVGVAADVGCPVLRIFAGKFPGADLDAVIAKAAGAIAQVSEAAEHRGVKLAIELHDDWCRGVNVRRLIDAIDSPVVGVCWDIANACMVEPLAETYPVIADRIFHVHFKDEARDADGKILVDLPGEGSVDLPLAMRLLRDGGYDRYVSFEWEKKWHPEIPEPEVAFPHYLQYVTGLMVELGVQRG